MEQQDHSDRPLILDELSNRLEQFRLLHDTDEEATDELLNELGGEGKVEREMLLELAATRPLALPDRVPEAHEVAMRALEVLARNGAGRRASCAPARSPRRPVSWCSR